VARLVDIAPLDGRGGAVAPAAASWRTTAGTAALSAVASVAGVAVYATAAGLLHSSPAPDLSLAESGAMAVAVGAAVGALGAYRARGVRRGLERRVDAESAARVALHASEAELRALMGALSDAIVVLDGDGRFLRVAPSATRRLVRAAHVTVGRRVHDLFPAADADRYLGYVRRALATGRPVKGVEYRLDFGARSAWFEATVSPTADGTVVWVARDITTRKRLEERLRREAHHDALTGLPNRARFAVLLAEAFAHAEAEGRQLAALFLDCDRLKVINDSLGHAAGDAMLRQFGERVVAAVRPGDVVARIGGDEFTVLLDPVGGVDEAVRVAERIQAALAPPYEVDGRELFTTASIGIALGPRGYTHPDEVLRDADLAMYRAKARGRARHQVFYPEMRAGAVRLLALENDLRRALDREELRVFYQPVASLDTGRVTGFEALVRWQHPEQGLVPPADFIPIAEETGLVVPIGRWVLAQACAQARIWQLAHPDLEPVWVSVNVSARQLTQPGLVRDVREALAAAGIAPEQLKLEITESIISADAAAAVAPLKQLDALGVRLDMDDFGTGHASLSYLHRFPISTVKIDQYFVGKVDVSQECLEIVRTILTLAHNLEMDVVAEGVETRAQLDLLRALGCRQVQGYLVSRPRPADEVGALIGRVVIG
jgi:diguanylate cyclase (GGDEF)-like protein/PAS domain S-box-containing protein